MTSGNGGVETANLPETGVWRIGPATDPYATRPPLTADELNLPRAGNRFDSPLGNYRVLYFGSTLEACFGETLARFRPSPAVMRRVRRDWAERGFMAPGEVPADWRHRRLAVRACTPKELVFLDAEAVVTRETLCRELAQAFGALGIEDLDVSVIRGGDRRVTRLVSWWAWSALDEFGGPRYGGVRYLSRLNSDWECWAIFDRVPTSELERRAIRRNGPALQAVARLYRLTVF